MDPLLHEAGLGLAGLAARREDWPTALKFLAAHCDANADDRTLLLYAQAAWRTSDARLATVLTQQGLARFPDQPGFRRLDLALLIQTHRWAEAASAARSALAATPRQAELWRQLAYCEQEAGHGETAVAALEAAWLVDQDPATRRRLAETQLALGQATAALPHFRALVGEPVRPEAAADAGLMAIAARAAADGGEPALARAWLAAVPPASCATAAFACSRPGSPCYPATTRVPKRPCNRCSARARPIRRYCAGRAAWPRSAAMRPAPKRSTGRRRRATAPRRSWPRSTWPIFSIATDGAKRR